jgi:hypothetical protein
MLGQPTTTTTMMMMMRPAARMDHLLLLLREEEEEEEEDGYRSSIRHSVSRPISRYHHLPLFTLEGIFHQHQRVQEKERRRGKTRAGIITAVEAMERLKRRRRRRRPVHRRRHRNGSGPLMTMAASNSQVKTKGNEEEPRVVFFPTGGSEADEAASCQDSAAQGSGFNAFAFMGFLLSVFNAVRYANFCKCNLEQFKTETRLLQCSGLQ